MKYSVGDRGYYGQFGGAYIPEMLYPNVEELRANYLFIIQEPEFKIECSKKRCCRGWRGCWSAQISTNRR